MAEILYFPKFSDRPSLFNHLYRSIWYFLPAVNKIDRIIFYYSGDDFPLLDCSQLLNSAKAYLSRDFDPAIANYAPEFDGKIEIRRTVESHEYAEEPESLKGILVWNTSDDMSVQSAKSLAEKTGAELVWIDPATVQQETLSAIRFVYKLFPQQELENLVHRCWQSFLTHSKRWKGRQFHAFGNGPSLEGVVKSISRDTESISAVCNSTICEEVSLSRM
jgi:hypothetical protein